jgi:hypothetical protein
MLFNVPMGIALGRGPGQLLVGHPGAAISDGCPLLD